MKKKKTKEIYSNKIYLQMILTTSNMRQTKTLNSILINIKIKMIILIDIRTMIRVIYTMKTKKNIFQNIENNFKISSSLIPITFNIILKVLP